MMQSSIPFSMGMLDAPFTSSAPSATNHFALPFRPHSLSSVESSTPVHSEQLVIPCVSCTVFCRPLCRFPGAFDEMQPGDRREALQVVHGECQRIIHQAVNRQGVLAGIDVRHVGAAG